MTQYSNHHKDSFIRSYTLAVQVNIITVEVGEANVVLNDLNGIRLNAAH